MQTDARSMHAYVEKRLSLPLSLSILSKLNCSTLTCTVSSGPRITRLLSCETRIQVDPRHPGRRLANRQFENAMNIVSIILSCCSRIRQQHNFHGRLGALTCNPFSFPFTAFPPCSANSQRCSNFTATGDCHYFSLVLENA